MKRFTAYVAAVALLAVALCGCSALAGNEIVPTIAPTHIVSTVSEVQGGKTTVESSEESVETGTASSHAAGNLISPTTGIQGTTKTYRPIIVQIENEPAARPQQGLQWADVVYETLIEGVDTRFTCVFNDILYEEGGPEAIEVGPVRSSRYYHQWIQGEWDALYIHQGGAETPGRESYIWGESADHIKQRINGAGKRPSDPEMIYRRRNTGKALEHTAYTELRADEEIMSYDPIQYQYLKFSPPESYDTEPEIESIELAFWRDQDFVEYRYDPDKDKLIRYMDGKEFIAEETGEPLEVQNLVVQYTNVYDIPGEGGRKHIDVFGSGDAEFIIHGRHLFGKWSREEGDNTPTKFTLDTGEEVTFAPGNTWIEVHPNDKPVMTVFANGTEHITND